MNSKPRSGDATSWGRRVVAVIVCAVSLLMAGSLTPVAASGKPIPPVVQVPYPGAPHPGASTLLSGEDPAGEASALAASCSSFETHGDYVHISGSDVSGHGWWVNRGCPASQADVTIRLQAFYSDGVWRYVGSTGRKRVYSGGGSANWANARVRCVGFAGSYGFRSVVDVDLVGVNDPAGVGITQSRNLPCLL
jgi:hypothetical protein